MNNKSDLAQQDYFTVFQSMVKRGGIKQRMIEANLIFFGLEANLPSGLTDVKCFFATDTLKLYIWTGSLWKSTTLA